MKTITSAAATVAAAFSIFALGAALGAPAFAQDAPAAGSRGHYEWRSVPQYGPRAIGPSRVRVWVPEDAQVASCNFAMMQASAADCMNGAVKPKNG